MFSRQQSYKVAFFTMWFNHKKNKQIKIKTYICFVAVVFFNFFHFHLKLCFKIIKKFTHTKLLLVNEIEID